MTITHDLPEDQTGKELEHRNNQPEQMKIRHNPFEGWKTKSGLEIVDVELNPECDPENPRLYTKYIITFSDGEYWFFHEDGTLRGLDEDDYEKYAIYPPGSPELDTSSKAATRYNEGKLRYDLESPFAREAAIRSLTRNSKDNGGKYESRNWERGLSFTQVIASLERHLAEIKKGNNTDGEEGFHHENLLVNAHMLAHYFELYDRYKEFDDRPRY